MIDLSKVVEAPAVLFLDKQWRAKSAIERMGVVFHSYHRTTRPYSCLIIRFWDEDHREYRSEEVKLVHVIRPIYEEEIFMRELGGDESHTEE